MLRFIRKIFGGKKADVKALVAQGAVIVDVRTPREYHSGHLEGSINYPLDTLKQHIAELRQMQKPIITVCRSGARSGVAGNMLKSHGVEAFNGGSWDGLQRKLGGGG